MTKLKEGDLVVHIKEGYRRNTKEIIIINPEFTYVSTFLGSCTMYTCDLKDLYKITKKDDPEYFI